VSDSAEISGFSGASESNDLITGKNDRKIFKDSIGRQKCQKISMKVKNKNNSK